MCEVKMRQLLIWLGEKLPVKSHHLQASVQPPHLCSNKNEGLEKEVYFLGLIERM